MGEEKKELTEETVQAEEDAATEESAEPGEESAPEEAGEPGEDAAPEEAPSEDLVDLEETIEIDDIFGEGIPEGATVVYNKGDLGKQEEEPSEDEEPGYEDELPEDGRERKPRKKSHSFILYALMLVLMAASIAFMMSPVFTIKEIKVEGNKFYSDKQVINMSEAETGVNIFLKAQKSKIKKTLMKDPYFKSVSVSRRLPGTLVIKVREKEELAALKYGDRFVVVDSEYKVLRTANIDPEVTMVEGLTIKKMDVGEEIEVEEQKVMRDTIDTLDAMKEGDFFFKHIVVSKSQIDAYIYDLLHVKGTAWELKSSIKEGRLQKIVNRLMEDKKKRGTIIIVDDQHISYSPSV